jgi:hypothetical protein
VATITVEILSDGSLVLPTTIGEMFDGVETFSVIERDGSVALTPQKQQVSKETLANYLKYLRTDDLLADTHKAKEESYRLFEDQGMATITLAVADALVGLLAEGRLRYRESLEEGTPARVRTT